MDLWVRDAGRIFHDAGGDADGRGGRGRGPGTSPSTVQPEPLGATAAISGDVGVTPRPMPSPMSSVPIRSAEAVKGNIPRQHPMMGKEEPAPESAPLLEGTGDGELTCC